MEFPKILTLLDYKTHYLYNFIPNTWFEKNAHVQPTYHTNSQIKIDTTMPKSGL